MAKTLTRAGQVNMKGRKTRLMRCGCCVCRDLRGGILKRIIRKEVKAALAEDRDDRELRYFGEIPL